MNKFAAFDLDGTLVRWQLYHAIATKLAKQGLFTQEQLTTIDQKLWQWKNREHEESFKTYETSLVESYLEAILNLDVAKFDIAAEAVFDEYKDQVYTYTRDLIRELKSEGYLLFAISGSQTEIVKKVADYYGFDDYLGTTFEQQDGVFTGKAIAPRDAKDKALAGLVRKHNATHSGSIAVGDSVSDISMLEAVERPIAFNPEKALSAYAQEHGWEIVIERKNTIYTLKSRGDEYLLA